MTQSPHEPLNPKNWKPARGYANGIAASGRLIFLGGLVGWTGEQEFESDDFVAQAAQIFHNIRAVLAEAGARPEHLVRLTWYVTDKHEYLSCLRPLGAAYRAVLGRHYPAMALVQVAALVEDRAKLEIEATAVLPEPPAAGQGRAER
ncbi:enamine deaminase RidA [Maritimibacter sp. 55A14]|uniref:RidA family protein n=1 Tax=Maritimibacter sp. 55A14 TaxID=2174844 RepID=UPI000D60ED9E|nr:RidA family protein [Maritimibacter sp. 55A14]PWE31412.1 enamine deaminase RidA [Maritimibacter sp. 55A14]